MSTLTEEERLLLRVRDALYEGSWDELREDLVARTNRTPSIFTLQTRIESDLERIERLSAFEQAHGVNLGQLLGEAS